MVWLYQDKNRREYAVKQISKKSLTSESAINLAKKEINIINYLRNFSDINEDGNLSNANETIIFLEDYYEDAFDLWLIFEKGGNTLSSLLFKIKGEFVGNERIYNIQKGILLKKLTDTSNNTLLLQDFIKRILQFLKFLKDKGVVHCDLKPENILIDYDFDENNEIYIKRLKIIDFGSSIFLHSPENFCSNTPEYLCPEINEVIEKNISKTELTSFIKSLNPWCMDMWSLGVIILEIIMSCPLWMSYKAKTIMNGKVTELINKIR